MLLKENLQYLSNHYKLSAGFLHEKSRFSENLKIEQKREIACNKPNRNYVFGLLHEISRLMLNSQFP